MANWSQADTNCCTDLNLDKGDRKLLQQLFGNCVSSDIFEGFREMAVKHLRGELESQKQLWYEHALEEIVDLMRGDLQPQEDANHLRMVRTEREQRRQGSPLQEPQPDLTDYQEPVPVRLD